MDDPVFAPGRKPGVRARKPGSVHEIGMDVFSPTLADPRLFLPSSAGFNRTRHFARTIPIYK